MVRLALVTGGMTAFAFLIGQWLAWRELTAGGYFLTANPANSFFYLITGMHGLHIVGGLVGAGHGHGAEPGAARRPHRLRLGVELCAMYWHFLLFVWLFVFVLLAGWAERLHRYLPPVADLERTERMAETTMTQTGSIRRGPTACEASPPTGRSDQRAFKNVSWGKAMMWIFLL